MCGHPFIKWNLLFFFLSAMVGLSKLQVVLLKMAPGGQVQRKRSGYFTQVMYADRTEATERGSYETGCWYPLLPGLFYFFPSPAVSLSGNGVHVIGCEDSGKWPYLALLRCLRQKKGVGSGQQPKYFEYFILDPHAAWYLHLRHKNEKKLSW